MEETELILTRLTSNTKSTIGQIESGCFKCWTLEDAYHKIKEYGRTRIPAGRYEIVLRKHGIFHERYKAKYPFHVGALELVDVPDFEDVLIHTGNHADDTRGCILVGCQKLNDNWVADSEKAYLGLYGYVLALMDQGKKVFIKIIDNK
jgi:hypothetical protein